MDDARKNILVAMSGGVDSSVAAALLLEQGCSVSGATLKLFDNDGLAPNGAERTCCSLRDVEDARKVCARLGVAHHVFNFCENFRERVVAPFVGGYCGGLTPTPCIDCNRHIKFDGFLDRAVLLGFEGMATGHYAVSQFDGASGRYLLKKPADKSKDQTYVLYGMTQRQLEKTLFPLGGLTKNEVRARAEHLGFTNAGKPDSQDICFVPDGDYAAFIERYTGQKTQAGRFVDAENADLGAHRGLIHYTVGQRKGLGTGFGRRLYVLAKDPVSNTVTLGPNERLYYRRLLAGGLNLIAAKRLDGPIRVRAKIRYSHPEESAMVFPLGDGRVLVEFEKPQRAPAPGQAVVFYDGDVVVGGATIQGTDG